MTMSHLADGLSIKSIAVEPKFVPVHCGDVVVAMSSCVLRAETEEEELLFLPMADVEMSFLRESGRIGEAGSAKSWRIWRLDAGGRSLPIAAISVDEENEETVLKGRIAFLPAALRTTH